MLGVNCHDLSSIYLESGFIRRDQNLLSRRAVLPWFFDLEVSSLGPQT